MIVDFFINVFAFVIVISIVVFIHEFGHYLLAIANGVKVVSFSIGFGKELIGWTDKRGTRWSVSLLPFGGYVQMFGDKDASSSRANSELVKGLTEEQKQQCLQFKSPLQKISVAFAGPFFNFLLAFVLLVPTHYINGVATIEPVVSEIVKDSPAEKSDFLVGDKILEVNSKEVDSFDDVRLNIALNVDDTMIFKVSRDNEIVSVKVNPEIKARKDVFGNEIKMSFVGVGADKVIYKKLSFVESIFESFNTIYNICKGSLVSIGQIITGRRGLDGLGGPIKIAKYSGHYFKNGLYDMIMFIVLISSSLGLMNLLPIPVLDGGLILICLIELLLRRPLPEKCEKYASMFGYFVLISLMVFTTLKDVKDVIFK